MSLDSSVHINKQKTAKDVATLYAYTLRSFLFFNMLILLFGIYIIQKLKNSPLFFSGILIYFSNIFYLLNRSYNYFSLRVLCQSLLLLLFLP